MHSGEREGIARKGNAERRKGIPSGERGITAGERECIVGRERGSFVGKGDVQQERGNTAAKWGNGIQSKEGWEAAV